MTRMIIYHHNDLDGRCAAAIMARYAEEKEFAPIEFIEVDYKDKIDFSNITGEDTVAILDFSFKPEIMVALRLKTNDIIWCDHHNTAKDYGYDDLPGYRDFSDKGLSGCECAWKYCYPEKEIPRAVKLIGDYDSWRHEEAPRSLEFYEGMKLLDTSPEIHIFWRDLLVASDSITTEKDIARIVSYGISAMAYRDAYCSEMLKAFGYETEIGGYKAMAINVYRFGSAVFGESFGEYPVYISYIHDGERFTVSLYSDKIDVSQIAKAHGGGGHKGAAGFVCDVLPFKRKK